MTRIEGDSIYPYTTQDFSLPWAYPIALIYLAAWVIGEARKNLNRMSAIG